MEDTYRDLPHTMYSAGDDDDLGEPAGATMRLFEAVRAQCREPANQRDRIMVDKSETTPRSGLFSL
jgi:hypothetical protein